MSNKVIPKDGGGGGREDKKRRAGLHTGRRLTFLVRFLKSGSAV